MILFTKPGCKKCDYIKEKFDLVALGITVKNLDEENSDALATLAWRELVSVAEASLPILVVNEGLILTSTIDIKKYLDGLMVSKKSCNRCGGNGTVRSGLFFEHDADQILCPDCGGK